MAGARTKSAASGKARAPHLGPERRRPLVLDAALRLFAERGYGGTSMEAIAAEAGVTKPVVYECFPNKEELFRALLGREEARLLESVSSALPAELRLDDIESLLVDGMTALLEAANTEPESWRVVFASEHGGDPAIVKRVRRARQSIVTTISAMVAPVLTGDGVDDAGRKAPVLAEALTSIGEAGVRIMLESKGDWTAAELGAMLGRVMARGHAAA